MVADYATDFTDERQAVLREKISKLLEGEILDESRLIQEVAYLADRADITEEIGFLELSGYCTVNLRNVKTSLPIISV